MRRLRFAYLSSEDPRNKRVWSGTHYSIYKALCSLGDVEILGPYQPTFENFISKILNQLSLKFLGKRISYRHSIKVSKAYARYFNRKLNSGQFDIVVAPAASSELAFIETKVPIFYITDGTFAGCLNYHKSLSGLTKKSVKEGHLIEAQAINKSACVLVSSDWAEKSVEEDYHKDKKQVLNFPYGANFELIPDIAQIPQIVPDIWKLLFTAVYWEDKGGDIVLNALKILREKGHQVELTVVGCTPPMGINPEGVTFIPFIDKNEDAGQKKLYDIFLQHHILLLPTRFDCTPIVINEASAFGIPSVAPRTGGVEGHLKDGVNGFTVDYSDRGEGYARMIEKFIQDPEMYLKMRKSSKQLYETNNNWITWRERFKEAIKPYVGIF